MDLRRLQIRMGKDAGGIVVMGMDNLVLTLLNRQVTVESFSLKVHGRLVEVSESHNRPDHKPCVLLLDTPAGWCIIRDWCIIIF